MPVDVGYAPNGESWLVNDQGLLIWAVWSLGLPITVLILLFIFVSISNVYYLLPVAIFLLSKYTLTYPFPIFFLALLISSSKFKLNSSNFSGVRSVKM